MDTERSKLRWCDVIRKDTKEKDRRSTRAENVEIENLMRRPHIGERPTTTLPVAAGRVCDVSPAAPQTAHC